MSRLSNAPQRDATVRNILLVLAALIVVIFLRAVFDATGDDTLGWTGYIVQMVLVFALLWLCAGRLLDLSRRGDEPEDAGWTPTTRSIVIVLVIVLLGAPVIRVSGDGEFDVVGLVVQIAALLGLLFIGARWIFQKIRER